MVTDQEIKAHILQRLVSIQSDTSDGIKEIIKRQKSKSQSESDHDFPKQQISKHDHSDSEHSDQKHAKRQKSYRATSESEQTPSKKEISRQASKIDRALETDPSAQLIEEEELETGRVSWGLVEK